VGAVWWAGPASGSRTLVGQRLTDPGRLVALVAEELGHRSDSLGVLEFEDDLDGLGSEVVENENSSAISQMQVTPRPAR
jgi:hypothetical protein